MDPWSAFLATPTTLGPSPGAREAWHRGRLHYAAWVVRLSDPAVLERRAHVAGVLAGHGVVGLHEAHITVCVAGFPTGSPRFDDDVTPAELDAQRAAAAALALRRPRLGIGGANAFASCPFLEVSDPEGVLSRLRSVLLAVRGEPRATPYIPHVTVGAFGDTRPTGPVAAALAPFRTLPPLSIRPEGLELVRFDAACADGPFHTVHRVEWPAGC